MLQEITFMNKEIGLQVKAEKPRTLTEGQNSSIEMEMWLKKSQPPSRNERISMEPWSDLEVTEPIRRI